MPEIKTTVGLVSVKVLNVCSNFGAVTGGGEAERSFQMTKSLLATGITVNVLTIDNDLDGPRKQAFGKGGVIALPCVSSRFYVPLVRPGFIRKIVGQADVIHLIGHWTVLNAMVYMAAMRAQKPYVICPAGALSIFGRSRLLKKLYNFVIGDKIIRNAAMCIAVTNDESLYFQSSGVPEKKIQIIPNGIASRDFLSSDVTGFRQKFKLGVNPFILFVGRLNPIKGPDLLLQAFFNLREVLKNVSLVFVGPDGGMLSELTAFALRHGMENRVHFVGYLGGAEKSDAYHAADLLVIPSRHEAMSIVALEAGICGTPVLLTDQCGFDEVSATGGGLVVPASVDGLQHGLTTFFASPAMKQTAGINLKAYVSKHFSWDVICEAYTSLYSRLMAGRLS
ncbi:MAG: glycosyltransferase family 4 protein [Pseudomonadota bacterium]